MILELLIDLSFGLAAFLVDLIPDINFDSNFIAGFADVAEVTSLLSYFLPIKTFMACLSVFFLLNNTQFIITISNWIIRKVPFIN